MRIRTVVTSSFALLLAALPAHADLLNVEANAAQSFATIQAAVDAAHDGDVVLVRAGAYPGFTIVDKDLSVVADVTGGAKIHGVVAVLGLAAGKTVVLGGLSVSLAAADRALVAVDDAGIVWIEDCQFVPGSGRACTTPEPGAWIENSARVVFIRSALYGSSADVAQGSGGDALHVASSTVDVHVCHVIGGFPSFESCGPAFDGGNGGSAMRTVGASRVYLDGAVLHGADGASGVHGGTGGDGGHGLAISTTSELVAFGASMSAGDGGVGCGSAACPDGAPGIACNGEPIEVAGIAPYITGCPPMPSGWMSTLVLYGDPGDRVFLRISPDAHFEFDADVRGVQLVRGGKLLAVGHLPPSGAAGIQLFVPHIAPAGDARRLFVQAIHRRTNGELMFGGVRAVIVLGPSL